MRLIGHLPSESEARTLADYLRARDIRNLIEPDAGRWAVWIYSEEQIQAGEAALAGFRENPSDPKFINARHAAAAADLREREDQDAYRKRVIDRERLWNVAAPGTVTLTLIIISVAVTLLMVVEEPLQLATHIQRLLGISAFTGSDLPEVRQGQVWRLVTPIFLHFGILHIVFNMMMLRDMGGQLESRRGPRRFLILVLTLAVASNLFQYYYAGAAFGGMSGVLYGLMGFIWMRGKSDPGSGLYLSPTTLTIMLVWFVLCFVDVIPHAANACHAAGLMLGMILGALNRLDPIF